MTTHKTTLAEVREQIASAKSRLANIDDEGIPKAEWITRAHQFIDHAADQFARQAVYEFASLRQTRIAKRPRLIADVVTIPFGGSPPEMPPRADKNFSIPANALPKPGQGHTAFYSKDEPKTESASVTAPKTPFMPVAGADTLNVLAWLNRDALKAAIAREIEASGYPEGPPLAERPGIIADLEAEIHRLEITEETLCRAIEAETGALEHRRRSARPEIVLAWDDQLQPQPKRRATK